MPLKEEEEEVEDKRLSAAEDMRSGTRGARFSSNMMKKYPQFTGQNNPHLYNEINKNKEIKKHSEAGVNT